MAVLIEKEVFYASNKYDRLLQITTLNSVADVYSLLRDSFKDIFQELMEAELDASLGYEKTRMRCPHIHQKKRTLA